MSQFIKPHSVEGWEHLANMQTEQIIELTAYAVKFARYIDEQYGVNEDEADAESGYPGGKICYSCGVSTTDGEAIHDDGCIIPEVARFLAIAKEDSK